MVSILKYLLLTLLPLNVWADLTIIDVRKNLPMSDSDPVYRDFYINGGSDVGLSTGMVLTVQRRMPLYDNYQNRSAGDLQLKVAKIKLIQVQHGLAVGRLHSEFTREGAPLLEDPFIMVGDQIDLSSASSDKKADASGESAKPVAAAAEVSAPEPEPSAPEKSTRASAAQIVVNSVQLPTTQARAKAAEPSLPPKVEASALQ